MKDMKTTRLTMYYDPERAAGHRTSSQKNSAAMGRRFDEVEGTRLVLSVWNLDLGCFWAESAA